MLHKRRRIAVFNAAPFQNVYALQSKFRSLSLCAVDAPAPTVQACSLIQEEGGYETKTDVVGDVIGRGGGAAGSDLM
jgi:hypothetical protein